MPLALLLLAVVAFVVWKLNATGQQFLPAFARLLAASHVQRSPFSLLSGLSYATGQFRGREVPCGCNCGAAGIRSAISSSPCEPVGR